jgi:mitogen-activated protein kinase 15
MLRHAGTVLQVYLSPPRLPHHTHLFLIPPRHPEILLGSTKYTFGVDIWAVGCILGEMVNGRPLFPGTSTMNQIERILECTGMPIKKDVDSISSPYAGTMLESLPAVNPRPLGEMVANASPEALDFIRECLKFNPDSRPSATQLLRHTYVSEFHNEDEEPVYPHGPLRLPIDDNTKLTAQQYRDWLYEEITNRRKESRVKDQQRQKNQLAAGVPV